MDVVQDQGLIMSEKDIPKKVMCGIVDKQYAYSYEHYKVAVFTHFQQFVRLVAHSNIHCSVWVKYGFCLELCLVFSPNLVFWEKSFISNGEIDLFFSEISA
jgi:hypothetical protein